MSSLPDVQYPPPAFQFRVVIGQGVAGPDTSFQEVSGIGVKMETEPVVEGGENRFVHRLPKGATYNNLVLKRGIARRDSKLVRWCKAILEGDFVSAIAPQSVMVYLEGATGAPVRGWSFDHAFPVSWEVENFQSTKNEVAIEKVEMSYTYSNRVL